MEQCDYLHLITIRGKNSSNSSTAFPKGGWQHHSSLGLAAAAGWDSYSGKLFQRAEELRAHYQHWELDSALGVPYLCWPHRDQWLGECLPPFSPLQQRWHRWWQHRESCPQLLSHRAPGLKPVRQCLRSFTQSIQEFSQQRKHWHIAWLLNSFLSFFLLSFFFFNWVGFFLQALSCNVLFHLIIAN